MYINERRNPRQGMLLRLGLLAGVLLASGVLLAPAADHRDGPIFVNTPANGRADINDVYVFQSPLNNNNTVMALTVSPFAGSVGGTPTTFDPSLIFDFKVVNSDLTNASDDMTFRVTF